MAYPQYIPSRPVLSLTELGQCKVRLGIIIAGAAWYLFWLLYNQSPGTIETLSINAVYFLYAIFHLRWTRRSPEFNPGRMAIVTLADQTLVIYSFMYATEALGVLYVFASPWISIGNGLRFGRRWMFYSATVAVVGMVLTGIFSAYWQQNMILLLGLLILNVTVPAYVAVLLVGLEESHAQLAEYADKLEKLALQDELTGLPNRTALYIELDKVCAYADRHDLAVALLYFDLDGFKVVNDSYGHTVGDSLLQETALRVKDILRSEDAVARLGGDEFVVLLQGQDSVDRAQFVADRILRAVLTIDVIQGHAVSVSASLGGVVVHGHEAARMSAEQLLHQADVNMYQAKREGKNRSVLTGEAAMTLSLFPSDCADALPLLIPQE
ncbi:MAG TPA: GGDEF domain-containing protein [Thiobacillus sp.]